MSEHNPPWKWHPKSFDQDHNGSIYSEHRPGHAYAIAMQPKYVTEEEWAVTAPLIVKAVNSHDALVKALEEIADACERAAHPAALVCLSQPHLSSLQQIAGKARYSLAVAGQPTEKQP